MSDDRDDREDPLDWRIQTLRGQLVELGSAVRQLNRSGLDSATAQLLLSRKRAELEDLIKRGRADARTAQGPLITSSNSDADGCAE